MIPQLTRLALASLALVTVTASASPTYTYIGSWQVDQLGWGEAPMVPNTMWGGTSPQAFTGQEAAAYLFGGAASDYAISTLGSQAAQIDHLAWVSTWAGNCNGTYPCGTKSDETFKISHNGGYSYWGDTSALIRDWAVGPAYVNYAFRVSGNDQGSVPEPASILLFAGALAALGVTRRATARRK